jgi:hypothetical protein
MSISDVALSAHSLHRCGDVIVQRHRDPKHQIERISMRVGVCSCAERPYLGLVVLGGLPLSAGAAG